MTPILLALFAIGPDSNCWDDYWRNTESIRGTQQACHEECHREHKRRVSGFDRALDQCEQVELNRFFVECMTGPIPKTKRRSALVYYVMVDRVGWKEQRSVEVIESGGECYAWLDIDRDGDIDLEDVSQRMSR